LKEIGKVLGTADAQPLDFWFAVPGDQLVQLDDVVAVERGLPDGGKVAIFGVVDNVVARHEGAKLESDVFLAHEGILPLNHAIKAHVMVTRVEPEIFAPPLPGAAVFKAEGAQRDQALFFDSMKKRFVLGLSRDREVVYGNFEFLDGSRGAHINISGVSGVATKTTYASFLLYGIFNSPGLLGPEKANTHALIFNVKGEDLLFLDKPNTVVKPDVADIYTKLGLPVQPFESVGLYAPVRREQDKMIPDTGTRSEGVLAYCWTIEDFCKERYLRFLFADADDETSHLSAVIDRVENHLTREDVSRCEDFDDLKDLVELQLTQWAGNAAAGTQMSFLRRLEAGAARVGHLIRGKVEDPSRHRIDWKKKQITVVDIHSLHDRAKRFVIGVMLKRMFEDKEKSGTAQPLIFVVLDELNKYAPREGWSPIKDVILDMAERGRSLGVILIGAQQTASQIERRVVANSSFRVVGRLDTAEAQHGEYGFLPASTRLRSSILKPGTMIVSQPEIPIPLLVQFPFPAWATRPSEAAATVTAGWGIADPFTRFK
jgi:DNA helicase HerA-like ATPase